MTFFPKKTMLITGLIAAVTTIGVYSATAGSGLTSERPAMLRANSPTVEPRSNKVIRIVGPRFLPDNGDIKLLGAARERAERGQSDETNF
jgi:hypothetical protein